jgi:hypothetical protein
LSNYVRPSQINKIRWDYTTEELQAQYDDMRAKIDQFVAAIPTLLDPSFSHLPNVAAFQQILIARYGGDVSKFTKALYDKLEYFFTIRTSQQHLEQLERCERIITAAGEINIPLAIFYDPQLNTQNALTFIDSYPTFYSYYEPKLLDGYGGYGIAFCGRTTELTDEELTVAMAHEFGHIRKGHCLVSLLENTLVNESMDYSINHEFEIDDLLRYLSLCQKIFGNKPDGNPYTGCTVLSWEKKMGGQDYHIEIDTYWRTILDLLKRSREPDPSGPPPPTPPPPGASDDRVKEGDIVSIRGSSPKQYGRVLGADIDKGKATITPMTAAEVQEEYERQKAARAAATTK